MSPDATAVLSLRLASLLDLRRTPGAERLSERAPGLLRSSDAAAVLGFRLAPLLDLPMPANAAGCDM